MKCIVLVFALLLLAPLAFTAPQNFFCPSTQQVIQGNGFTVGFSCSVSSQPVIIPINSHGNTSDQNNFVSGNFNTWDYSLTLLSSQIQGLSLSGTYVFDGMGDTNTWTLSGVGNIVSFTASGYIVNDNLFTVGGGGTAIKFFAPGPVPESSSFVLCFMGASLLGLSLRRLAV